LFNAQAQKIAELEAACASLKQEKENVTIGYQRLSENHKALVARTEQERAKLAKAHTGELVGVKE
jgi:hypothetical protein